jgi:hypothetical protein
MLKRLLLTTILAAILTAGSAVFYAPKVQTGEKINAPVNAGPLDELGIKPIYCLERGLPLKMVKCQPEPIGSNGTSTSVNSPGMSTGNGEVLYVNLGIDFLTWFLFSYILVSFAGRKRSVKKRHLT